MCHDVCSSYRAASDIQQQGSKCPLNNEFLHTWLPCSHLIPSAGFMASVWPSLGLAVTISTEDFQDYCFAIL